MVLALLWWYKITSKIRSPVNIVFSWWTWPREKLKKLIRTTVLCPGEHKTICISNEGLKIHALITYSSKEIRWTNGMREMEQICYIRSTAERSEQEKMCYWATVTS